jgi:hypothetical protein
MLPMHDAVEALQVRLAEVLTSYNFCLLQMQWSVRCRSVSSIRSHHCVPSAASRSRASTSWHELPEGLSHGWIPAAGSLSYVCHLD